MSGTGLIQISGAGPAGLSAAITLARLYPFFGLLLSAIIAAAAMSFS